MSAKLWVDDERPAPSNSWRHASSSKQAIVDLTSFSIDELSLDHDLGWDDTTRPIIVWLCEQLEIGWDFWPDRIRVHSANPVGRDWLRSMIERYAPDHVVDTTDDPL